MRDSRISREECGKNAGVIGRPEGQGREGDETSRGRALERPPPAFVVRLQAVGKAPGQRPAILRVRVRVALPGWPLTPGWASAVGAVGVGAPRRRAAV